jgi:FlaA1/EpsC-like NDP-sugar epimerase
MRLAQACAAHGVERLVLVSSIDVADTDHPACVTRLLAEQLVRSITDGTSVRSSVVRFGSILGGPDSVVRKMREQIRAGGPVIVGHPELRRYFMLLAEAVTLALHAAASEEPDVVHVLDMGEPLRVADLARNLIRLEGMVPDTEVAIQYSDAPSRERLLDALSREGEQVSPSTTPGLLRVRPEPFGKDDLLALAGLLTSAARRRDERAVRRLLKGKQHAPAETPIVVLPEPASLSPEAAMSPAQPALHDALPCPSRGAHAVHRSRAKAVHEHIRKTLTADRRHARLSRSGSTSSRSTFPLKDLD